MKLRAINENFTCLNCSKKVAKLKSGGYRDHCLFCLYGLHVDKDIPGDRQSDCKGLLVPISLEFKKKKGYIIVYKCQRCGEIKRNKAAKDDNYDLILELSAKW